MKGFLLCFIFLKIALITNCQFAKRDEMFEMWQTSSVSIGIVNNENKFCPIGTGVLFYVLADKKILPVVVTAKHVLENKNIFYDSIRIRFSWHDSENVYKYHGYNISLKLKNNPLYYFLQDSNIDLALFPLLPIQKFANDDSAKMVPYTLFANPSNYVEGGDIYILGYPNSLNETYWTRGLIRKGIIAWVPTNKINEKKYLIDCNTFLGNSGGPVFSIPPIISFGDTTSISYHFMGIITNRQFEKKRILDEQTNNPVHGSGGTIVSEESMGVTIVEPASNVKLLLEEFQKQINQP